jgi:amino acid adenylation domain-containing protein/non-ribosomal peptide synthase protein (TIGR01720 family)
MSSVALQRVKNLSPTAQKLLQRKLKERSGTGAPVIPRSPLRESGDRFPCSFAQQRLWFLHQVDPAGWSYNSFWPLKVTGDLDAAALARSLAEVVRRHEVLRTTFEMEGEPVQVVAAAVELRMPVVDLGRLSPPLAGGELQRLAREHARHRFDLGRGLPLRAALVKQEEREHVLLLTVHHVVTDDWSMGVLVREVVAAYTAFSRGEPSPLPELDLQYADFAHWQRQRLAGEVLEGELRYWRGQFAEPPPPLELPTDRPRPAAQTTRGANFSWRFRPALLASLQALGRSEGATLFMTLLAAFQVLLARCTGRDDVTVGSPIAGRNHSQLEPLIGCFVNTLALRARLAGDPEFLAALRHVQEVALGAFAHQDLPFEKLIAELQPERDLARTPVYQVMFSLHNVRLETAEMPAVKLERLSFGNPVARLDLILNLQESAGGLGAAVEYSRDLFDAATIQRLMLHYEVLLEGIAADPSRPLSLLPVLSAAERHALLLEWNDTAETGVAGACVHEMFAAHAERTPEAPAVMGGGGTLTYLDLQERSRRLACALRRLGVGPDVRVGLCLDRSPALLVTILGVLKAGGAYVPLDPALPQERLAFIVEDALGGEARRLVLTEQTLAHRFADGCPGVEVLLLDSAELAQEDGSVVPPSVPVDALAYVLYTSGSTGRPKGVAVHHRGLTNYLSWSRWAYRIAEGKGAPVHSSISFDLTVTSLLAPLAAGAPVTLLPESEDAAASLAQALRQGDDYSLVKLTPAHLRALGHTLAPGEAAGATRALVVGGEALLAEDLAFWRQHAPATRILNEYGPTETVVGCAVEEVSTATPDRGSVPIGRPIWNSRLYVLDRHLQPVPVGVAGEVYIGGEGVARGYLGRPALTAERFVPAPFPLRAGERLYRSGDLARILADGRLDYLGRADDQVKIRGYRIEPGEIEAQLAAHPGVAAAAVVAAQSTAGSPRLVACVVPAVPAVSAGGMPGDDELRRFLSERLPAYMVPALFLSLEALPLTANGKVDRQALVRLGQSAEQPQPFAETAEMDAAPLTPVEEILIGIWKEVLCCEVGRHDNFFELGGDSILSLQVASRARKAGLRVNSRQLFANPTVARLASVATPIQAAASSEEKPAAAEVPLTPIQRWFFAQGHPRPEHTNLSVLLEVQSLENGDRVHASILGRAVGHLLEHHDALRLRFEPPDDGRSDWRQVSGDPSAAPPPFTHVDLRSVPAERGPAALEELAAEVQASLSLATGPLLRAALVTLGDGGPDRLLLVAHHLVVDGVSWRVLLEDLETICRQLDRGDAAALPPVPTSFQSWAGRLAAHAGSGALDGEAGEWLQRLWEAPPPLPQDRDAGPNNAGSARSVTVALSEEETRALLQEVPRVYRTQINDVLLAALVEAFGRWTGSRRLLLELEGHGREELFDDVDLSRTVGWLTSHFPVLLDLEGLQAPGEALKAAKEQLRAVPGRGIGWGLLRYLRGGDLGEALAQLPRPEVVFNYLGQLDQSVAEGRLFRAARESAGAEWHWSHQRPGLLVISGAVGGDRLYVRWIYSENRHLRATVERLAHDFVAELRALIAHCLSPGVAGCTPSDFPLARLGQPALDRLVANTASTAGRIEDLYPATPMQQGMLFHALQAPGSGVYVVQIGITMNVDLDVRAFERAWERLIERHPAMRTAFAWDAWDDSETPLQVVHAKVQPPWLHLDWRSLSSAEQAHRLASHVEEDRRRGFDLGRPPLMRLCLIRLAEQSYRFLWTVHHLITDGWSSPIVLRELFALYRGFAAGEEPQLGALRPYRDYVAWLVQQDPMAAEELWRRTLQGLSAPTSLGIDRGAAAESGEGAYGSCSRALSAAASEELRALSRRHQLTLNTLLQGAWACLLGHYSGDDDVLFGAVTAGRSAPVEGIEQMVGLFINTLPVRARLAPEAELLSWLRDLQERQLEVRQYEHSPLSQVRAWSEMGPASPLFESILIFENYPVDDAVQREVGQTLQVGDVKIREQTNYPLTVVVGPARRLTLEIAYDAGRIDGLAALRMLHHLQTALESMPESVHLPLAGVPLLAPGERHQVLNEWNDSGAQRSRDGSLHELFAAQAARAPEAPAVLCEGRVVTYGELAGWASRLALRLRGMGVGPGARVGICLPRSPAALASMLGILAAGAAYVPLDPESPPERLAAIVADSRMELLLTDGRLAPALADLPATLLTVDSTSGPAAGGEGGERVPGLPDGCAYVIYTSGSTGIAKGVEVTHRGAVNYVRGMLERVPLGPGDRILLFAPLSFDASVVQIFPALASGACVVVHPNPRELTSEDLLALCEREQLTVFDLPGAVWRQWVQDVAALRRPLPQRLHTFFTGGESVPAALFRAWAGLASRRLTFLSSYGPTEATVAASVFIAANDEGEPAWSQVPIGRPLPNVRLRVLDRWLRPSPVGVPGQLFAGGPGLARGYLGRPDWTAEVFLPDPLPSAEGGEPGGRLYRTGDLARYLPDGNLEFLGRADHQVKVRGFRIELAEIESALSRHGAVREAVVLLREDRPGDKRLVAYVVPHEASAAPTVSGLRGFLAEALPPYMLPSAFVTLGAIPVLASGKVDRAALPMPDADRPDLAGEYTAPRTAEEELLAGIWAQVLRVERVGVFDNFFELGGDSILTIQIVARASQAGFRLTPKQLFDHQTVAELARVAQTAPGIHAEQGPVSGPVPLLPIQRWFFAQGFRSPHHFNNAFLLGVRQPLAPAALARLAAAIVAHHDALRLRFTWTGEAWEQTGAASEPVSPWAWIDLGSLPAPLRPGAQLSAAIQIQSSGLDLARGPLTRLVFFARGEDEGRLLWLVHHLAVDGVSWRILLEDLGIAYQQLAAGESPALPAKTTSFKRWAERLVEHARSDAVRAELPYWLTVAAAACPPLPVDFGGGDNALRSMRSVAVFLSPEETRSLLQELPSIYHTQINDALLTALAQAFADWTGSTALRVDLEGHGREPLFDDVDLSRTVGWFTTQYPVIIDPGSPADCGEALLTVKEQLRQIPGRGIGYGLLRYLRGDAEVERLLSEAPEAEVGFNYLGQFEAGAAEGEAAFAAADEPTGPDMDLRDRRPHLLEISGVVTGGQLHLRFNYSANAHRRTTIERLAEGMGEALRRLIDRCRSAGEAVYTVSDFPLASLDAESFREVSALLDDDFE